MIVVNFTRYIHQPHLLLLFKQLGFFLLFSQDFFVIRIILLAFASHYEGAHVKFLGFVANIANCVPRQCSRVFADNRTTVKIEHIVLEFSGMIRLTFFEHVIRNRAVS